MLSKSQISLVKGLQQKKNRKELGLFVVEGLKSIIEFLNSDYSIDTLYYTKNISLSLPKIPQNIKELEVSDQVLEKISNLQTPQGVIALVKIPQTHNYQHYLDKPQIHLVIDGIQDPGNLGTIIRTANWFGYKHIFCSINTVDVYNSKVVQATMGALSQVQIIYTDLKNLLGSTNFPVYGGLLDGYSLYDTQWQKNIFLVLGNEGSGISDEIKPLITHPITIPGKGNTESLNVAISAAIFCSEIQRNMDK
jgi:TrmH family RNA methyltransferase